MIPVAGRDLPGVMAVGIRPEIRLAVAAHLEVGRGITVNDHMITSDPDILAVGECVEHNKQLFGLVAPLYDQAKVVAKTLAAENAAFQPVQTATKLKVTGCDLVSAGDFADSDSREDIVFRDPARGVYKRLVIENDKLIGAVMYGDTADGNWFFGLIKVGTDIAPMRDSLIFGPAFQGGTLRPSCPRRMPSTPPLPVVTSPSSAKFQLTPTTWGEKDGTVTNSDRTVSRQRPMLPKPGQARHDWDILADVGRRMGWTKLVATPPGRRFSANIRPCPESWASWGWISLSRVSTP